jgi:hypothetical protein
VTEETQSENTLKNEFENLASNLKAAVTTAWESEERKKLQDDILSGLTEVGKALDEAAGNFSSSEAGQQFKADMEDLGDRIRSGELEEKVRNDLVSTLQKLNTEIEKLLDPKEEN